MRIRDQRDYDEPGIDLVPLIDVILVLIIFFVITTTFDVRSTLQLQLPVASPQAPPPARTLNILVNADGRYFVGEREVLRTDIEAVKQAIAEAAGDDRDQAVMLRADARTPYQAVVTAQDALAQLGFRRIAIATAPDLTGQDVPGQGAGQEPQS
jgi:biopolymer transport protein ExbD